MVLSRAQGSDRVSARSETAPLRTDSTVEPGAWDIEGSRTARMAETHASSTQGEYPISKTSLPPSCAVRARRTACSMFKSEEQAPSTKTRPASVSSTRTVRRLSRVKRRNPHFSSIPVICRLRVDCVMCNLWAARVKFNSSANATTARKCRTSTSGNTTPRAFRRSSEDDSCPIFS